MSRRVLAPFRDSAGNLAPGTDTRWVGASTMAIYEGVSPTTVYRRGLSGYYPAGATRTFSTELRYCPAACLALPVSA